MSSFLRSVRALTKARFLEFFREPEAVFWTFGFPIVLALVLGIAFRERTPAPARIAFAPSAPAWAREAAAATKELQVVEPQPQDLARKLRSGAVDLVVEGPGAESAEITYRFDASREEARFARAAVDAALQRARGRVDVLRPAEQTVSEPGARYVDWLFPGLLGMNVMMSSLWGLGYTIVLHRQRKLLKRLAVTPIRPIELLLSYFLSRLVFLALEIVAILAFGSLAFGVSVSGSWLAVGCLSFLGAGCFAAIALFVASRADTIESASGWLNFVTLPMWLLSGSFYSYERFPESAQPFIKALPLTALNDGLRAVMGDGEGIAATWPQVAILAAWTAGAFLLGRRAFRW